MKERPILMSAPMVRACLQDVDPKEQTRRIVKLHPALAESMTEKAFTYLSCDGGWVIDNGNTNGAGMYQDKIKCPYGQPGDRLWVKETWATAPNFDHLMPTQLAEGICILKRADNGATGGRWRPSIFMRRWMSRITLEITAIRVERLQDISEADAKAEGAERMAVAATSKVVGTILETYPEGKEPWMGDVYGRPMHPSYRTGYWHLWTTINDPDSWDANPWVWVITFKRITP